MAASHLQYAANVLSSQTQEHSEMVLTDRSLMLRMGVGAAGSSSTWGLIDPLIAGIGHRAMTPATPPGFQSDGTTLRQRSTDVVSKSLRDWRQNGSVRKRLIVWQAKAK